MKSYITLLIVLFSYKLSAQITINEVMASNVSTIMDGDGDYSDWIELKNSSASAVDLANYYITDKPSSLTKFRFTSSSGQVVVPANGYLIIWASGKVASGTKHTSFSLSSTNGESVVLVAPDGTTIIDQIDFPSQSDDISYGKNSSNQIRYFQPASPGAANSDANAYEGLLAPPVFSSLGGFFSSNFSLSLSHTEPGVSIYYTLDGSNPDPGNLSPGSNYNYKNSYPENPGDPVGSMLYRSYVTLNYSSPINITNRTHQPNQISMISSTNSLSPSYFPTYNIHKGMIVRAVAVKAGYLNSKVSSHTYLYSSSGVNPYAFDVTSVITPEPALFDYEDGIYTAGMDFDAARAADPSGDLSWCSPGNYKRRGSVTEKTANFELIKTSTSVLNQLIGLRIQGGCTRNFKYKSLRLYGQNQFDEYPLFDDPDVLNNRAMLRNSGNDQAMTFFKDPFAAEWMKHLNFGVMRSKPTILFLNGEYWGIHNLRDRIDKYYLENLYKVDPDNVDIREFNWNAPDEMSEGDDAHYVMTDNFISNNNLAINSNYEYVKTLIDEESFIDYHIAELYLGNIDWPNNNVRMWRTKNSYSATGGYSDGRWRYIFYDLDRALGEIVNAANNDFNDVFIKENIHFLDKLLDNSTFKNKFINRWADLLNTSFRPEFATPLFNGFKSLYQPEISNHISRWKTLADLSAWNTQCDKVATYISQRKSNTYGHINTVLGTTGTFDLTVETNNLNYGHVKVNSIEVDEDLTRGLSMTGNIWTGTYFDYIPLEIKAVPKEGFEFSHWTYNGTILYDSVITINTESNKNYKAYFILAPLISANPTPAALEVLDEGCKIKILEWARTSPIGSSPAGGKFVYFNQEDPGLTAKVEGFTAGPFNLEDESRINGKDNLGISFINTGEGNPPFYEEKKMGGLILAFSTIGMDSVKIEWKGRTHKINSRQYGIRLQYRDVEKESPLLSVTNFNNFSPAVNYARGGSDGHSATLTTYLPASMLNKPYVQLLWRYYHVSGTSGKRDELGIDDIVIYGVKKLSNHPSNSNLSIEQPSYIYSTAKIIGSSSNVEYNAGAAIHLKPGFEARSETVFKAEIVGCN